MVIDDLDVIRITLAPDKADAPLFVYPDTVLAFPVVMQSFQVIGRGDSQGLKKARRIENIELDCRRTLNHLRQLCGKASVEQLLGLLAIERLDHGAILSHMDIIVKGYHSVALVHELTYNCNGLFP